MMSWQKTISITRFSHIGNFGALFYSFIQQILIICVPSTVVGSGGTSVNKIMVLSTDSLHASEGEG